MIRNHQKENPVKEYPVRCARLLVSKDTNIRSRNGDHFVLKVVTIFRIISGDHFSHY